METTTTNIVSALEQMRQHLGVLSTIHAGNTPESAVVYFSHDTNLNLYIVTRKSSRKYQNLLENQAVSFVVFTENPPMTLQIEGTATFVTDPGEQAALFSEVVEQATKRNPLPPVDQMGESEIAFIKITTTWARFGNFEIARVGDMFEEVTK